MSAEAPQSDDVVFENGEPAYEGTLLTKCFKEHGNGLLFRIVNEEHKIWAFYNDTTTYDMVVRVTFAKGSVIEVPEGSLTTITQDPETEECTCEVIVKPTKTELFIRGEPLLPKIHYETIPHVPGEEEEEGAST